jgi:hypothetical protein
VWFWGLFTSCYGGGRASGGEKGCVCVRGAGESSKRQIKQKQTSKGKHESQRLLQLDALPFYFITKSSAVRSLSAVVILRSPPAAARACECVFAQQRNSNAVTDKFYFANEGGSLIVLRARAPNQISRRKHTRIRKHTRAGIIYLNLYMRALPNYCGVAFIWSCWLGVVSFRILCPRCVLNLMAIAPRFV